MMRRILAIARVEVVRLLRTPVAFALLIGVPALQVVLFGTAIRPDGAVVRVAIAAPAAPATAPIRRALAGEATVQLLPQTFAPGAAEALVRGGEADIAIELPERRSFANPFLVERPVRFVVDARNPAVTGRAAARIEARYWRGVAERNGDGEATGAVVVERLYNPDGRADWTFLPSLIGVTVMISMIMLGTLSLAREREGGTWETLLALPARPIEILIGKLTPYVVLGTMQGAIVLGVATVLFALPMRGSIVALGLLLPLLAAAHLVLGYALAARARTQVAALQGAIAFYLPAMLLSGFIYPFATLPGWAQTVGNLFPLTHFIRAATGATLVGDGFADVVRHGLPIAAFLSATLIVAVISQARRID